MAQRIVRGVLIGLAAAPLYAGGDQKVTDAAMATIVVEGRMQAPEGTTDTASEGTVSARQLADRPILRPAEVLETVPGLIVTQHSGDGKANQYFLRGFSLDHGTDFYTTVEGMPTNLPTHAHGQGYNDLNFLIPELISSVAYKKGPYDATAGDFSSTGSALIRYADTLPNGMFNVTAGSFGHRRLLNADALSLNGGTLLYAAEYFYNDGPWEKPEGYRRVNGVVSYAKHDGATHYKITAMGYEGSWDATNHVPLRAIASGLIGRYGSLDPTDGGETRRYSLSGEWMRTENDGTIRANAYAINYGLDLFSNFTYDLNDPVRGDQFEQKESRHLIGGSIDRTMLHTVGGRETLSTFGLQLRRDAVNVGLFHTQSRTRIGTVSLDGVTIAAAGLYAQSDIRLADKIRMIAGVRGDLYRFDVQDRSGTGDAGGKTAMIASPKLSLIFGPWAQNEIFVNGGYGFHSNDARGIVKAADPATPLVRTKGAEVGVRTYAVADLQSSLAVWTMDSDSELVFAGDTGGTEPTGPSRRLGIEWANYWTPAPWFILDADAAVSRARYTGAQASGARYVPEAIEQTVSVGAAVTEYDGWFGGARLRYFGSRALIEDDSQRSRPSTLINLRLGRHIAQNLDASCDVYNLLDRKTYDIEYYYASRLPLEPSAVDDRMVHPGEPRSLRVTLSLKY